MPTQQRVLQLDSFYICLSSDRTACWCWQVGDEAVVCYRGKQNLKYLGTVTSCEGKGEDVRYGVRYADGDTEEGVKPKHVIAFDKLLYAAAIPGPVPSNANTVLSPNSKKYTGVAAAPKAIEKAAKQVFGSHICHLHHILNTVETVSFLFLYHTGGLGIGC